MIITRSDTQYARYTQCVADEIQRPALSSTRIVIWRASLASTPWLEGRSAADIDRVVFLSALLLRFLCHRALHRSGVSLFWAPIIGPLPDFWAEAYFKMI